MNQMKKKSVLKYLDLHLPMIEATPLGVYVLGVSSLHILCYSSLPAELPGLPGLNDNIHFDFDL